MDTIIEVIKLFLVPGSINFLMLGMTVGVVLLFRRGETAKWGKRLLTLLAVMYWVMSTPICSNTLESLLSRGNQTQVSASELEGIRGIVVLGGGSSTITETGAMYIKDFKRIQDQWQEFRDTARAEGTVVKVDGKRVVVSFDSNVLLVNGDKVRLTKTLAQ